MPSSASDHCGATAASPLSSAHKPLSPKEFSSEFETLTRFPLSERWVQLACARGRVQTVFGSFGRHLIPRSELERLATELIGTATTEGER